MEPRDLSQVLLLNPKNQDFLEGKEPFRAKDLDGAAAFFSGLGPVVLMLGGVITLALTVAYIAQEHARSVLLDSVRAAPASVSGCGPPGFYDNIHFHFKAGGVSYDPSTYHRIVGDAGLIDACAAGFVTLNYLAGDPNRWAIAPDSPITRKDREDGMSGRYLAAGPGTLLVGLVLLGAGSGLKQQHDRGVRLKSNGIVVDGVLTRTYEDESDDSSDIFGEYRFANPSGVEMTGKNTFRRRDISRKNLPAPGTRLLIIYADDKTFQAL